MDIYVLFILYEFDSGKLLYVRQYIIQEYKNARIKENEKLCHACDNK